MPPEPTDFYAPLSDNDVSAAVYMDRNSRVRLWNKDAERIFGLQAFGTYPVCRGNSAPDPIRSHRPWLADGPLVRNIKEGETRNDIFAFLTINPNAEVGAIHPKVMPVIPRTPEEYVRAVDRGDEAATAPASWRAPDSGEGGETEDLQRSATGYIGSL